MNFISKKIMVSNINNTSYVIVDINNVEDVNQLINTLFLKQGSITDNIIEKLKDILSGEFDVYKFQDLVFKNIDNDHSILKELNEKKINLKLTINKVTEELKKVNQDIEEIKKKQGNNSLWVDRAVGYCVNNQEESK